MNPLSAFVSQYALSSPVAFTLTLVLQTAIAFATAFLTIRIYLYCFPLLGSSSKDRGEDSLESRLSEIEGHALSNNIKVTACMNAIGKIESKFDQKFNNQNKVAS